MDAGQIKIDETFYNGDLQDEPEVDFSYGRTKLRVWEGFVEDLFEYPKIPKSEWGKMSRDYFFEQGPWAEEPNCYVDAKEYYNDLLNYRKKKFRFDQSRQLCDRLIEMFAQAAQKHDKVKIVVE